MHLPSIEVSQTVYYMNVILCDMKTNNIILNFNDSKILIKVVLLFANNKVWVGIKIKYISSKTFKEIKVLQEVLKMH